MYSICYTRLEMHVFGDQKNLCSSKFVHLELLLEWGRIIKKRAKFVHARIFFLLLPHIFAWAPSAEKHCSGKKTWQWKKKKYLQFEKKYFSADESIHNLPVDHHLRRQTCSKEQGLCPISSPSPRLSCNTSGNIKRSK